MNPYDEIHRLQEELARLKAQLSNNGQNQQEIENEENEEKEEEEIPLPCGRCHMDRCYDVFQNIMENQRLPVTGTGESYKMVDDDNQVYYFMKGRSPGVYNDYLMIQIGRGLVYLVKQMDVNSYGDIIIRYGSSKQITLTLFEHELEIGDVPVISIKRINRTVKMNEDMSKPGGWEMSGQDQKYIYSLEGNDDIIDIQQHPKRWRDQDGNIIKEYFI